MAHSSGTYWTTSGGHGAHFTVLGNFFVVEAGGAAIDTAGTAAAATAVAARATVRILRICVLR
ncbi:hypothetical protein GCM10028799_16430 [Kribbella italica]